MKSRICITLMALVLSTTLLNAQMHVGLRLGTNLASYAFSEESTVDYSSSAKLYFGIPVGIPLSDNLWFCPELAIVGHGGSYTSDFELPGFYSSTTEGTTTITNLEFPLNVKFMVSENISVMAGPYFGFAMSGNSSGTSSTTTTDIFTGEDITITSDFDEKIEDWTGFNKLDFGVNVGAGYMLPEVGPGDLMFNLGYSLGLADLADDDPNDFQERNRGIQITVGYMIELGM